MHPTRAARFRAIAQGLILGEGGAMLVLENSRRPLRAGLRIHREIVGFGMSSDAHHITQPLAEGAALAMTTALTRASALKTSGTSTRTARAPRRTMRRKRRRSEPSSVPRGPALRQLDKIDAWSCAGRRGSARSSRDRTGLGHESIPPTVNSPKPTRMRSRYGAQSAREPQVEYAMSNSFAFGGLNAVLVFRYQTVSKRLHPIPGAEHKGVASFNRNSIRPAQTMYTAHEQNLRSQSWIDGRE